MRRVAVIVGSISDYEQCVEGFDLLHAAAEAGKIEIVSLGDEKTSGEVLVSSIHRAPKFTNARFEQCAALEEPLDVLILGAGCANALTGGGDSYLRYELQNTHTVVIGVAFHDPGEAKNTQAAKLGITQVPETQVVSGVKEKMGQFIGPFGFQRACQFAIDGELPELTQPPPVPPCGHLLVEAAEIGRQKRADRAAKAAEKASP